MMMTTMVATILTTVTGHMCETLACPCSGRTHRHFCQRPSSAANRCHYTFLSGFSWDVDALCVIESKCVPGVGVCFLLPSYAYFLRAVYPSLNARNVAGNLVFFSLKASQCLSEVKIAPPDSRLFDEIFSIKERVRTVMVSVLEKQTAFKFRNLLCNRVEVYVRAALLWARRGEGRAYFSGATNDNDDDDGGGAGG